MVCVGCWMEGGREGQIEGRVEHEPDTSRVVCPNLRFRLSSSTETNGVGHSSGGGSVCAAGFLSGCEGD